jgi:hypothetical protein
MYFPFHYVSAWLHSCELQKCCWLLAVPIYMALFGSKIFLQNFSDFPSHRIFGHINEVLNIDKK